MFRILFLFFAGVISNNTFSQLTDASILVKGKNGKEVKITPCYPDGLMRAYCISFDDGILGSDWGVIEVLKQKAVPATFFINSAHLQSKYAMRFRKIYEGFEVASHGAHHKGISILKESEIIPEIADDIHALSDSFSQNVYGHAYPYGDVPKTEAERRMYDRMLDSLGLIYARGTVVTKSFKPPTDFLRWNLDGNIFTPLNEYLRHSAEDTIRSMICFAHSIDFAKKILPFDRWLNVISEYAADTTIWKSTMKDYAIYVKALRRLKIKNGMVYNGTDQDLWIKINNNLRRIAIGETVNL